MFSITEVQVSDLASCLDLSEDDVESYSGRGMYGRSCLGITVGRESQATLPVVLAQLAQIIVANKAQAEGEDSFDFYDTSDLFVDVLSELDLRSDSMGLGTVYYFPNVVIGHDVKEED